MDRTKNALAETQKGGFKYHSKRAEWKNETKKPAD